MDIFSHVFATPSKGVITILDYIMEYLRSVVPERIWCRMADHAKRGRESHKMERQN
jgi:hypothetical protein